MTDFNEQVILAAQPVFINGFADSEQAPSTIGDTNYSLAPIIDAPDEKVSPDETTLDDGGDLARSPDILSSLAVDLERAGLADGQNSVADNAFPI